MKFGHTLTSEQHNKDSNSDLDSMEAGHRLSADDYDFDEEDWGMTDDTDELTQGGGSERFKGKGKWVKRFGALMFIIGGVLNFMSFGFAAQSLLASLGSVQFVSNVVFGKFVLGEMVTAKTWLATLVICVGNMLIVYFSNRDSKEYTAGELFMAYSQDYKWYCLAVLILLFIIQKTYNCFKSMADVKLKITGFIPNYYKTVMAVCYALFSAILGTQQMLQAKCLSELLRMTFSGNNQFFNPFTYGVIFVYIIATVFWLYRMNEALQRYDGLFIIPVLQVFWLVFTIVSGGIYFQEFHHFSQTQMIGFVAGVLVVFLGVYLLMPSDKDDDQHHQMHDVRMGYGDERDSDLFPDLDVEINEDFNSNRRRKHSSDPEVPEGLPPLGEGIPSSSTSSAKPRTGSVNTEDGRGGKGRTSSLDSGNNVPGKGNKKKSMAFGFYDPKRKTRTRLLSFGFMPVVSMDRKVNKFTDWTIEKKKYWKPVQKVGRHVLRFTPLGLGSKGFEESLFEVELRRRTLTQDGVVDSRGNVVDMTKINEEWEKNNPRAASPVGKQRRGSGIGGANLKNDLARGMEHRRSFSQPPEDIARLMKNTRDDLGWGKKGKAVLDGGVGASKGESMDVAVGNFKGDMRRMDMEGGKEDHSDENVIERGVRKMSDAIEGLFESNKDKDEGRDSGTHEESRDILGGEETDDDLSVVGEGLEDETDDDDEAEEGGGGRQDPLRKGTKS
ncbi:hypothetical protein TL16_g03634 [Triparma laevis f. inornata]|uniref:Magnesium transporter n=1 Tax=Triparma laevis f. inornata TaxID=1714386 RepID=A0A9W7A750_9STRA|nr:hypothetical protein TL16_g03634 [Triparma laevis f. inornata]